MIKQKDIVIIGAGPAGLAAAIYSARNGYSTLALDPMGPGGQLMFIDELENYPGLPPISGYELIADFEKQAEAFGAEIEFSEVSAIRKADKAIIIASDSGEIEAKAAIIATGTRHKLLGISGEKEYKGKGVSYCATCDGAFFRGKKAIVVGGGDTALTEALYLSRICSEVTVVHRRSEFRGQRILQDRLRKKDNIHCIMNSSIKEILGNSKNVTGVLLADGRELQTDSVFIFIGTEPNTSFISGMIELQNGYIITDSEMRSSEPGIFAAGDVRKTPLRQVVTAASDGAIAAEAAAKYIESL